MTIKLNQQTIDYADGWDAFHAGTERLSDKSEWWLKGWDEAKAQPELSRFIQPPGESTGFTIVPPDGTPVNPPPNQDAYDDGYLARVSGEPLSNVPAIEPVSWVMGWQAADKAQKG